MSPEEFIEFIEIISKIPQKMLLMKKPIIIQIQGTAVGFGMILIMASDLRIFADRPFPDMFFKMPEIELSMNTSAGSSFLPILVFGLSFGKSIMMTSDKFGLEELPPRFATRIFPLDELESETENFMKKFAKNNESLTFLLKTKMTIFNKKYIEKCFALEQEVMQWEHKKLSTEKWDEIIKDLFERYP